MRSDECLPLLYLSYFRCTRFAFWFSTAAACNVNDRLTDEWSIDKWTSEYLHAPASASTFCCDLGTNRCNAHDHYLSTTCALALSFVFVECSLTIILLLSRRADLRARFWIIMKCLYRYGRRTVPCIAASNWRPLLTVDRWITLTVLAANAMHTPRPTVYWLTIGIPCTYSRRLASLVAIVYLNLCRFPWSKLQLNLLDRTK